MSLNPETCAHCLTTMVMTEQAFARKTPPPEAIRSALLAGLVVGENAAVEKVDVPVCEECAEQIAKLREELFAMLSSAPPNEESNEESAAEPQEPA